VTFPSRHPSTVENVKGAESTITRDHCLAPGRSVDAPIHGAKYGRLFPELESLESEDELLHRLGSAGGPCDPGPREEMDAGDDARVEAGWPFFGQFVAHDITADRSPLVHRADPRAIENFRSPRANLECVYGSGPVGSPYLFERDDPARLLHSATDVPRNEQGVALVGDPRNDVHLFMNQMHLGFLRAHNVLVERLRAGGEPEGQVFDSARLALVWHYQWVLLHDFLPMLIGEELSRELLTEGPRHYRFNPHQPYIPFEFADAAYRYGHSQIRHDYRIQPGGEEMPLFPDLIGFGPVGADHAVDWSLLFDAAGEQPAQRSKRIDGTLPASLLELPTEITGELEDPAYRSLASRDLQRGQSTGLPSGEQVARRLGVDALSADEVGLSESGWDDETPLWFYILREADVRSDGDRLGPVGGRIVGEVLVGIVDADAESFRSVEPGWRPTLPASDPRGYTLLDLLRAGDLEASRT
jgi:Animal haem peroxidase